jgi:hypothetical protein
MTQDINNEQLNKTTSLEVPTHDIDEFDKAVDAEKQRTAKAVNAAEYNRKKYGDAKDRIGELEAQLTEKDQIIERKNTEIARLRRADRGAREVAQTENKGELNMLHFVAGRMNSRGDNKRA